MRKIWDDSSFLEEIHREQGDKELIVAKKILTWSKTWMSLANPWGSGAEIGSFSPRLEFNGNKRSIITLYTSDEGCTINLKHIKQFQPFDNKQIFIDLTKRLRAIYDMDFCPGGNARLRWHPLCDEEIFEHFLKLLNWVINSIKSGKI